MRPIDISTPSLCPQVRRAEVDGMMEDLLNVDAVIAICQAGDTPEARKVYRVFRRNFTKLRNLDPQGDEADHKLRAIVAGLKSIGVSLAKVDA